MAMVNEKWFSGLRKFEKFENRGGGETKILSYQSSTPTNRDQVN